MNFEPQKFFIGIIDFFSVLLPGTILAYLGKDWIAHEVFCQGNFNLKETESLIVFIFISYLLGHLVFLIGSLFDSPYDWLRHCTVLGQMNRLSTGRMPNCSIYRKFARWTFGNNPDEAVRQVLGLKARALEALGGRKAINAFQWANARLGKDLPEGLSVVQRFEADSKFFRGFVIVLLLLFSFALFQRQQMSAVVCVVVAVFALWRYADQRFKSTQQAYWFVLTLEGQQPSKASSEQRTSRTNACRWCGCL